MIGDRAAGSVQFDTMSVLCRHSILGRAGNVRAVFIPYNNRLSMCLTRLTFQLASPEVIAVGGTDCCGNGTRSPGMDLLIGDTRACELLRVGVEKLARICEVESVPGKLVQRLGDLHRVVLSRERCF